MMSEMEMLYLICKHVIYFLFRKAGGGGGVSMSPYRNKTTPCTGFFFCIPLGILSILHIFLTETKEIEQVIYPKLL
jgi:hypothetical protein